MIKARLYDFIVSPIFSEKATQANGFSKYTFKVSVDADKKHIKESVEKIFGVKVKCVNVMNVKPKKRIFKGVKGLKSGYKKAIITLDAGQTIDLGIGA